jgi:predicted ester cyclase
MVAGQTDLAQRARRGIENICSGREPDAMTELYSPEFVDHVNDLVYYGYAGAEQSIALYRELFADLSITVEQQVAEGRQVASRWRLNGTHRGRAIELRGIVISRFDDSGRMVEDWSVSDTLQLVKQLGVRRSLGVLARHWRLLRTA